jgi:hypothetical protein
MGLYVSSLPSPSEGDDDCGRDPNPRFLSVRHRPLSFPFLSMPDIPSLVLRSAISVVELVRWLGKCPPYDLDDPSGESGREIQIPGTSMPD